MAEDRKQKTDGRGQIAWGLGQSAERMGLRAKGKAHGAEFSEVGIT